MARVTFVKKARKDNSVCKAGESYYWWKFNYGPKMYSLTPPNRSQLTRSSFLSQMYDIEDEIASISGTAAGELRIVTDDLVQRIRDLGDECQGSLDNMPEGLQEGPTGEILQSRVDECEGMAGELESIDLDDPEDEEGSEKYQEWIDDRISELSGVCYNGE